MYEILLEPLTSEDVSMKSQEVLNLAKTNSLWLAKAFKVSTEGGILIPKPDVKIMSGKHLYGLYKLYGYSVPNVFYQLLVYAKLGLKESGDTKAFLQNLSNISYILACKGLKLKFHDKYGDWLFYLDKFLGGDANITNAYNKSAFILASDRAFTISCIWYHDFSADGYDGYPQTLLQYLGGFNNTVEIVNEVCKILMWATETERCGEIKDALISAWEQHQDIKEV